MRGKLTKVGTETVDWANDENCSLEKWNCWTTIDCDFAATHVHNIVISVQIEAININPLNLLSHRWTCCHNNLLKLQMSLFNLWHQYLWSSLHFCRFQALQRALHLGARSPLAPCPLSNFGRKMLGFRLVLGIVLNAKIWKNHSETTATLLIVFQCFGKYEWNWRWPYLVRYFDRFQVFNSSEPLDCYASHNSSPGRRRARPSLRTALAQVWILTAEQISANKLSWWLLIRTLAVLFTVGRFDPFQDLFSLPKPGGMRGSCGRYPANTPLFPAGPNFVIDVEVLHSNMINAWLLVQSHSARVNGKIWYHPDQNFLNQTDHAIVSTRHDWYVPQC